MFFSQATDLLSIIIMFTTGRNYSINRRQLLWVKTVVFINQYYKSIVCPLLIYKPLNYKPLSYKPLIFQREIISKNHSPINQLPIKQL